MKIIFNLRELRMQRVMIHPDSAGATLNEAMKKGITVRILIKNEVITK